MFWPWVYGSSLEFLILKDDERNAKMALIGDTEKMENKMKAKMTRKEAIEKILPNCIDKFHAEDLIKFYIEAGMLEVVEEEKEYGLPIGFSFPFDKRAEWTKCVNALNDQGFIIVKKA